MCCVMRCMVVLTTSSCASNVPPGRYGFSCAALARGSFHQYPDPVVFPWLLHGCLIKNIFSRKLYHPPSQCIFTLFFGGFDFFFMLFFFLVRLDYILFQLRFLVNVESVWFVSTRMRVEKCLVHRIYFVLELSAFSEAICNYVLQ